MSTFVLYVDGASRGNPGEAAIGASLQNDSGEELDQVSLAIGMATNNCAEYRALIEGLKLAKKNGLVNLEVRADSELMVRQINGEYRVKDPGLKALWKEVKNLTQQFEGFSIVHVPREENKRADQLANQALD